MKIEHAVVAASLKKIKPSNPKQWARVVERFAGDFAAADPLFDRQQFAVAAGAEARAP